MASGAARKKRRERGAHRSRRKAARPGRRRPASYWSQHVTETSNALDLEPGVFKLGDPAAVARSLRRSAERSDRRKSDPFRSAMSMLVFYINRAGRNLPKRQKAVLERAKQELRRLYGRGRAGSEGA